MVGRAFQEIVSVHFAERNPPFRGRPGRMGKESMAFRRLFALHLTLAVALWAPQSSGATGDGGTRSIFSLGAGSRSISLGRAFVSLADDASAVYWNPAALRNVQGKEIMVMYMPVFGDFTGATYTFFGTAYPTLRAGSMGFAFMRIASTFRGYDSMSRPTGEEEYSESQFIVAYAIERRARFLLGTIATGLSFKIVNQRVSPFSSTSAGIDLGFRYIPDFAKSLSFATNIQDLSGARHKLVETIDQTYQTIMAGVGYRKVFANGSALSLMLEVDLPERADRELHAGAEYAFSRYLALRLGVDRGDFTFGLGVNVRGFGLDYAMFSREGPGSSHPVTFTTRYGKTLYEQRRLLAEKRSREEEELIREAFTRRVSSHRERAKRFELEGKIAEALDQWKIVHEYVPGDSEATQRMEAAQRQLVLAQEKANRDIEKQGRISENFSQGLRFYSENDYVKAKLEWLAILEIDPGHREAREYLQKTQRKIEELVAAHLEMAEKYEKAGRLTEAIGEWNNIRLLDPENTRVEAAIARIQKRIELVNRDYQIASKKLRVVDLYNKALREFNRGEYEKSMDDLRQLLKLDPQQSEARKLFVMAKRKLTPLTKEEREEIQKLYLEGMQYFSKDQYKEAILRWEKILEIDPSNESVRRNIQEARDRLKKLGR